MEQKMDGSFLEGFSPVSSTPVLWKSRKRSASVKNLENQVIAPVDETPQKQEESPADEKMQESQPSTELSERRKALFEPLEPVTNANGRRPSAETLLPPPDFDAACYPKGWLAGKRRKLVNVDVVESMRRIALRMPAASVFAILRVSDVSSSFYLIYYSSNLLAFGLVTSIRLVVSDMVSSLTRLKIEKYV